MRWDSGSIKLIISMGNAPFSVRLLDTKGRCRMERFVFSNHSSRVLDTKKYVNDITLFFGEGPLSCDTVFGSRNQIDFMTDTLIRG